MAQQSALYSALYYLVHFSGLPDYEPLKRIKLVFIWVSFSLLGQSTGARPVKSEKCDLILLTTFRHIILDLP